MVKSFIELKKEMVQCYVDFYEPTDTNEQIESWLKDVAPDFDFKIDNSKMNSELNFDDIIDDENIFKIENENKLDDKQFVFKNDKWITIN